MHQVSAISFPFSLSSFSEIIDVRSPSEYAIDHLPGAINLPVLDDAQREEVGILYKQNTFEARRLGAVMVSANISKHIQNHLMQYGTDYSPLIYCWRGGMRSRSFSFILNSIGWKSQIINGGYQAFRKFMVDETDSIFLHPDLNIHVLSGLTGVGKTRLLSIISDQGGQVLDLENLANHKGSLLGANPYSEQPTQKKFETQLWFKMKHFDLTKPIFVESESNRIGNIHCPTALWNALKNARVISVQLPISERLKILLEDYPYFKQKPEELKLLLNKIIPLRGHEQVTQWQQMIHAEQWEQFVQSMLETHYDICYRIPGSEQSNYLESSSEVLIENSSIQQFTAAANQIIHAANK